ncbi:mitochondrial succinate-fumarate transporter 1 [Dendrobium catenatum]|uniref:mitochondrial succinate-fumarate transporter 1 n=1 Tax=Dendrobium catenatum TaxID=906689 RepID=UPI0010A0A6C6|nr:mitochondrial succinate-fumarate transporter 1 [Dendrobium catenatum]
MALKSQGSFPSSTTGKTSKSGSFFRRLAYINLRFFCLPAALRQFLRRKLLPAVLYQRFMLPAVFRRLRPPVSTEFWTGNFPAVTPPTDKVEIQVVKIRLQQQRGLSPELLKYKGPIHCARTIIHEEGFFGLWAGAAPTVMRNGTNQAAMFTAKNAFDVILWKKHEGDGKVLQPWQSMISGFLAGTCGPICTGPFDVVKTRLMAQSKSDGELKYKGMIHAIRTIYVEEGVLALWKGLLPRLMRIPPGQAIMWTVADQITGFYERNYLVLD